MPYATCQKTPITTKTPPASKPLTIRRKKETREREREKKRKEKEKEKEQHRSSTLLRFSKMQENQDARATKETRKRSKKEKKREAFHPCHPASQFLSSTIFLSQSQNQPFYRPAIGGLSIIAITPIVRNSS